MSAAETTDPRPILVTGGAGFIGSNFVNDWLAAHDETVVNLDALTYAGNLHNLDGLRSDARHVFVQGDIGDRALLDRLLAEPGSRRHLQDQLPCRPSHAGFRRCLQQRLDRRLAQPRDRHATTSAPASSPSTPALVHAAPVAGSTSNRSS